MERRALAVDIDAVRIWSDQAVEVAGLELVRLDRHRLEIADAVERTASRERVAEGQRGQRQIATCATAANRHPGSVDQPLLDKVLRPEDAVVDIVDTPRA